MRNQFGRLKSSLEFTDYYHLTNQQLEELLKIDANNSIFYRFSKLFFFITRKWLFLILFTSQNTNITAQLQKVVTNCFLTTLKTKKLQFQLSITKPRSSDF
jgi:hypothetical protein